LAVQIGLHAAPVSGAHLRDALADRDHLDTEFVTGNPRIGVEGHLPEVSPEVGATDTHLMHPDHRLTRAGR
jgi:hypothetical protein